MYLAIYKQAHIGMYMYGFALCMNTPGAREMNTKVSALGGLINTRTHKRTRNTGDKSDKRNNM